MSNSKVIEILYEDDNFLIVNKPAGLVVHSTVDKSRENLYDLLKESRNGQYLGLHHRLDRGTSGAILFTKNEKVNGFIQQGFSDHTIIKKYQAIVHGDFVIDDKIEDFLKKEKIKNKDMMVKVLKGGQKAISLAKTITHSPSFSLVEFTLLTGRMHQIRVQSKLRGYPLVGDDLYGDLQLDKSLNVFRMLLHSKSLEFIFEDKAIKAEAPLDPQFQTWLNKIK